MNEEIDRAADAGLLFAICIYPSVGTTQYVLGTPSNITDAASDVSVVTTNVSVNQSQDSGWASIMHIQKLLHES